MPMFQRFRLLPLILTLALTAAGIWLGQWQTGRALEKEAITRQMALRQQMPAASVQRWTELAQLPQFSKVLLRGQFISQWPLYLDNRPLNGVSGRYVLMPFLPEGSQQAVVVMRGWQPRDPQDRNRVLPLRTPAGMVEIEGSIRTQPDHVMQLGQPDVVRPGVLLQNLDLPALAAASGLTFSPALVMQTSAADDGLERTWPRPDTGAGKHRAYALQWYALSVMTVVFFVVTGIRRGRKQQTKN